MRAIGLLVPVLAWAAARHLQSARATPAGDAALLPAGAPLQPRRGDLFAVADLHGDLDKAAATLRLLGVVDEGLAWTAPAGVTLVQLGDMPDRGPSSTEVVALFDRLAAEAAAAGSRVITLLGNHDLFALSGDVRYVSPVEMMRLGAAAAAAGGGGGGGEASGNSSGEDGGPAPPPRAPPPADPGSWPKARQRAAMSAGVDEWRRKLGTGEPFGEALRRRELVALEGEGRCRTLFVHAGLLPRTLRELLAGVEEEEAAAEPGTAPEGASDQQRQGEEQQPPVHHRHKQEQPQRQSEGAAQPGGGRGAMPELTAAVVARINAAASRLLRSCVAGVCSAMPRQRGGGRLAAALQGGDGPVWTRALAQAPESGVCPAVERLLAAAGGAARIAVGHTVQEGGRARARCGGRVLLLDTGMSADMAGAPAAAWACRAAAPEAAPEAPPEATTGPASAAAAANASFSKVVYDDGVTQAV